MRPLSVITKVSIAGPGSASEASHISPRESDKSLRIVHQEVSAPGYTVKTRFLPRS